ncbi:MAG: 4-alpha-glucanotransferase [Chitinophagaceae bacterium]
MKIHFYLRFHTRYGQSLWITGDAEELGNNLSAKALSMNYLNDEFWHIEVDFQHSLLKKLNYKYILKGEEGDLLFEWGNDRSFDFQSKDINELLFIDTWNHAGEYENTFFTAPFNEVLLKSNESKFREDADDDITHIFKVKAPLVDKNEIICLTGNTNRLGNWSEESPVLMVKKGNWWTAKLNLSEATFPIAYKYGKWNKKDEKFICFENENNRIIHSEAAKMKLTVIHDGFIHLPNNTWKGSGVAIPVFSLRSKNSFGVGEFVDIKLLVDWGKITGLKLIQLLPVNDTIATHTWMDSYPYAAISAFALHPLYINILKVAGKKSANKISSLKIKQKQLNELAFVDYENVMKYKLSVLKELYEEQGTECFSTDDYQLFLENNKHWLYPYAAFCYFRDKYGTSHYDEWKTNSLYDKATIEKLLNGKTKASIEAGFYCFIQYHLHLQLKEAADYAHKKGIVLKGDIPIGIYRYGCDAWVEPGLYNMNWQAGAPPDDFTAVGQNWGFPTYNWQKMQQDDFAWWKQRFEQMSNYFDAFRIDHILGFFRIWSIPADAIQGILGKFVPCLPIHKYEFGENGISFDYHRFCKPFITDEILWNIFHEKAAVIKEKFLLKNELGGYDFNSPFETQKKITEYFSTLELNAENESIKQALLDLIANVILFEEENTNGLHYHFRIAMDKTLSFGYLSPHVKEKLHSLYIDYFFHRQDDFWKKEALQKLPPLKAATNMLVCGEDLGMVADCVNDVMKQLGILSLEIQRMPKDPKKEFFHPNDAPYLSVITPSTHDMSTIRGWWEENRERTQKFYNTEMGQWGEAPFFCESWINRAIVLQHLYSPAMWSIFQLQDILGMNDNLRRENPLEERINNPANPKNYWQYRMHILLEDLIKQDEFNEEFKGYVVNSGRV